MSNSDIEQQAAGHMMPDDDPNQTRTIRSIVPVSSRTNSRTNSGSFSNTNNDASNNASTELVASAIVVQVPPSEASSIANSRRASIQSQQQQPQQQPLQSWSRQETEDGQVVYDSAQAVTAAATADATISAANSRKSSFVAPVLASASHPYEQAAVISSRKPSNAASVTSSIANQRLNANAVSNRIALDLLELLRSSSAVANPSQLAQAVATLSSTSSSYPMMVSATASLPTYSARHGASSSSAQMLSDVEAAILRSSEPVNLSELDEIEVLGQRGIWANKNEVLNWKGALPINEYRINEDANPEVITKRSQQTIQYIQELAVRYLRPPTPPAPGEIVITQEPNVLTPPAPPLVIRQQPPRPITPEPLVVREAPPPAPQPIGRKLITISGKRLPPPPRKVVIERLAQLPAKPQSVLIERWLPYAAVKRRVIFQAAPPDPILVAPRNTIVQWEAPDVHVRKEFKYLGVIRANPAEYVQAFGTTLRLAHDLPDFVHDIKTPEGLVLAANYQAPSLHELEGDLNALALVDLDREGLSGYRQYLIRLGVLEDAAAQLIVNSGVFQTISSASALSLASPRSASVLTNSLAQQDAVALEDLISQIFQTIDRNHNGRINVEDAEKTLLRLNSRLGRRYGEDDVRAFFSVLDVNNDGSLDLDEFKRAFLNIAV